MKKKIIVTSINSILCLIVAITFTFAWFTNSVNDSQITITSARVASEIEYYIGDDFDLDGVFDYDVGFTYIGTIKESGEEKFVNIEINNFLPTEVYTYRFIIKNKGDVAGYTTGILSEEALAYEMTKCLSITLVDIETTTTIVKSYLGKLSKDNLVIFGGTVDDIVNTTDINGKSYTIMITFETEEALIKEGIEVANYNELQGKNFNIDLFDCLLSSSLS